MVKFFLRLLFFTINGEKFSTLYTLFQNGRNFSVLLFTCNLACVAGEISRASACVLVAKP